MLRLSVLVSIEFLIDREEGFNKLETESEHRERMSAAERTKKERRRRKKKKKRRDSVELYLGVELSTEESDSSDLGHPSRSDLTSDWN